MENLSQLVTQEDYLGLQVLRITRVGLAESDNGAILAVQSNAESYACLRENAARGLRLGLLETSSTPGIV
jgi:hypothetical protein